MAAPPLIAIIDDDVSLLQALVRLIRSYGYATRGFASAELFIQSGELGTCSCVVTDIQMPGMSGLDLLRYVAGRQPKLPVIAITARADPGLEERALGDGATCFLRKPVDTEELVGCLETAIKGEAR